MTIKPRTLQKNGSWGKNPSYFQSTKNNKSCWVESILERDGVLFAEFDRQIIRYETQPISTTPIINGKEYRYTSDLLILNSDGQYSLREVKPDFKANSPEFLEKFKYYQWHIEKKWNIKLSVWKESEIRIGDTIKNLESLYYYRRFSHKNTLPRRSIIRNIGRKFTFGELKEFLKSKGHLATVAFECVAWDMVEFDRTIELNCSTELEVCQ